MKKVIFLLFVGTSLFAQWDNAYGYGSSMLKPNSKINYEREFHRSIEDKMIYDESMKNPIIPVVEVEDKMHKKIKMKREKNKYKDNSKNFFYSSNKKDYYKKDTKKYHKFPTTDY